MDDFLSNSSCIAMDLCDCHSESRVIMEPSNYALYIKEREGFELIESEKGFASYKITGPECYIRDIYVRPEFRKQDIASKMADEITKIAKTNGCRFLTGSVDTNANNSNISSKVLLSYGFNKFKDEYPMIYYIKEI